MFSSYRGMTKEARYLIYSAIFPSVAYGMFYTDISYFLTKVQGLSSNFMGLVVTTMGVSTVLTSVPLGIAADRYGRKRLLIIGNVIASAIIALFALTTNSSVLLALAIFEGISEAAFSASASALLAEKIADSKRNSAFSLYSFAQSAAFGLGSVALRLVSVFQAFGIAGKAGHIIIYVALAILSLASTFVMLKVSESRTLKKTAKGPKKMLPTASKNVLIKYVLTSAIIAFGAGLVVPLMSFWMSLRYGISDTISGPILGISSIIIGVSTLAAPPLAKKFGLVNAVVLTQIASTLFMFATPLSPNYLSASVVYTTRAFLMNMANPLQQSMIMGLVAADERGAASGISSALWRLPNALSTFIGAWLMGKGVLAAPFFLASLFYVVSITLFWHYFRFTKMPEEQNG